jgi:hypothetical protein
LGGELFPIILPYYWYAYMTIKKGKSAGPFTRCGTVTLEQDYSLKIGYDTDGRPYTVFILNAKNLLGNRDFPPVPLFSCDDGKLSKTGYASRSPSGRSLILNCSTSNGFLSIEWSSLVDVINGERKQVHISRLNAPLI